ncbi:MAG: MBL fold metallo-hydrolase [Lachnospiraceae bacterium]|nr:MBL fold metallo-hydrolase [Lachnospiraceae bacterium]
MKKNTIFNIMPAAILMVTILVISAVLPVFAYEMQNSPEYGGYFRGEELKMLSNQADSQMMSFVITSANGAVIVIDGGTEDDSNHLREELAKKGNHVSAWFITHPHSDHAGALARIIEEGPGQITIDGIYYNFADPAWYQANESYRAGFVERVRADIGRFPEKLHVIHRGDQFDFDGVHITCMNDPYLVDDNAINNSSCVLKAEMGGKKIMFLGDMGENVGNMFLRDHAGEDLKVDMVQMAHHGQAGVGKNVYEVLSPKVCLWCAPGWLYDDPSYQYQTGMVRNWMRDIGATRNYCIKDGDRTLR